MHRMILVTSLWARLSLSVVGILVGLLVFDIGCDGSAQAPVTSQDGDIGNTDAGRGGIGVFDSGVGLRGPDGGGGRSQGPPPVPSETAVRLPFPPRARLIGLHETSCTNETPADGSPQTADRWCGFYVNGELLGRFDLWVFNLSQAVRQPGTVTCTDPNGMHCRRLTTNLWTGTPSGGPTHPFSHAFNGDTLIYYADAISAQNEIHKGPVYAWRPGWAQGRAITGSNGVLCNVHFRKPLALCLTNLEEDMTRPLTFDLTAGQVLNQDESILPLIDRILPLVGGDDGVSKWRSSFSSDGAYFAYSVARVDGSCATNAAACENIRVIPTASLVPGFSYNPAAAQPIVQDGSRFTISRDGQSIFWLSRYNYSTAGDPSGVLRVADFPSGANPRTVSEEVGAYVVLHNEGAPPSVAYFWRVMANSALSFRWIDNVANPGQFATITNNIVGALVTADRKYTLFNRTFDNQTGLSDLWVIDNARARANPGMAVECALQASARTDLWGPAFPEGSGMVFWADNINAQTLAGNGWRANPADCSGKTMFARDVDFWFLAGNRGILFSDTLNTDNEITLRFAQIRNNMWPADGSTTIQTRAHRVFGMTLPQMDTLLYQLDTPEPVGGLYTYKLPFDSMETPPDAGAPDAESDAN